MCIFTTERVSKQDLELKSTMWYRSEEDIMEATCINITVVRCKCPGQVASVRQKGLYNYAKCTEANDYCVKFLIYLITVLLSVNANFTLIV